MRYVWMAISLGEIVFSYFFCMFLAVEIADMHLPITNRL